MKATTEQIADLATRTRGPVYRPGDDGYDEERTGYQLLHPHRPQLIVAAAGAQDVRTAVEYAAGHRLPLAVQATGHGLRTATEGVLISTRRMTEVTVDPSTRTAWLAAGATWAHVIEAAAPHGLAPLSGSFPGVGAVSYTLGGGLGLLARRYGYAADQVRSIDLVTPDGRLRHVTSASEPDLFWALRGGGGGLGVVTGMEVELVPVTRLFGGGLFFDVAQAPDVLDGWYRWTRSVPDEMTSAVGMLPYPDIPAIPEQLRGRHIAQIQISHLGSTEEGRRLVEPLRSLGPCVHDTLRELPYVESGKVFDEPDQPHPYRSQNRLLGDLDARALAQITRTTDQSAPVMCVVGVRHLGGALARAPRVANAVGHRDAAYSLTVLSPTQPGQEELVRAQHEAALAPFARYEVGRSLNFSFGPLDEHAMRSAFDEETWGRLAALRSRYDPDGLLRPHHPLPTAGTD